MYFNILLSPNKGSHTLLIFIHRVFSLDEYEKSICMMKTNIPEDMTIEVKSHEKQQQRFLKLECTGRHDFTSLWSTN